VGANASQLRFEHGAAEAASEPPSQAGGACSPVGKAHRAKNLTKREQETTRRKVRSSGRDRPPDSRD
jgi:hypothetical protein